MAIDRYIEAKSNNKAAFNIALQNTDVDIFVEEDLTNIIHAGDQRLYSNEQYEFCIIPKLDNVVSASIYINGNQPVSEGFDTTLLYSYDIETSTFKPMKSSDKYCVFNDVWGYAQIHIRFETLDGTTEDLYTKYIAVDNSGVDMMGMASKVYSAIPDLLVKNGLIKSKILAGLNQMSEGPLELKLTMIRKVLRTYDQYYNFFMTNARFTTKQIEEVDKLERLNSMTISSLQYAVQHPEELYQVDSLNGIKYGRQVYHPRRIKMEKPVVSYDTYENQVIVGFLDQIIRELDSLDKTLQGIISGQQGNVLTLFDHMFSRDYITGKLPEIERLRLHMAKLLRRYTSTLKTSNSQVRGIPRATHIFRVVPQYREIFECIREWYHGVYDFEQDRFLLYCVGSSRVYESFVLVSILEHINELGYVIEASKFKYDVIDDLYQNTTFNNTFKCIGPNRIITVYYQPVVYSDGRSLNGINLKRVSSSQKVSYYTPDYIIKIEKTSGKVVFQNAKYVICDAKFSNLETVEAQSFKKVIEKYEARIEPTGIDSIDVNCVVYGKYNENDPLVTVFGETRVYKNRPLSVKTKSTIMPLSYGFYTSDINSFRKCVAALVNPDKMQGLVNG